MGRTCSGTHCFHPSETPVTPGNQNLRVVLGEYDIGFHTPAESLGGAEHLARNAHAAGARVLVLPEMATTGFTMDPAQAVPLDAQPVQELSRMAKAHRIWIVAGIAAREEHGNTNVALVLDDTGAVVAIHRKRRLFAYGGEDRVYRSASEHTLVAIDGVRCAIFICYELRFPELFAPVAQDVDAMLLIANWPAARRMHWDTLLRARAIENQCVVIGVNRTGDGDGIHYDGGSVAFGPWGEVLPEQQVHGVRAVDVDPAEVARVRGKYPFLRDRGV